MATLDVDRGSKSSYQYSWIALVLQILAVLLGFAPTYFKGVTFSGRTAKGPRRATCRDPLMGTTG